MVSFSSDASHGDKPSSNEQPPSYIPMSESTRRDRSRDRYHDDEDHLEDQLDQTALLQGEQADDKSKRSTRRSFAEAAWARLPKSPSFNGQDSGRRQSMRLRWLIASLLLLVFGFTAYRIWSRRKPPPPPQRNHSPPPGPALPSFYPPFDLGEGTYPRHWTLKDDDLEGKRLSEWQVPKGTKVVGIVFYGRRRTASLLDCYLQRNLKRNGGMLDEVIWMQGTTDEKEVKWMQYIANNTEGYSTWYNEEFAKHRKYKPAYSVIFEEKHAGPVVYVKIDDDIVFVEDIAIPAIVQRLLTDPHEPLLVGANVVNQAALSWIHYSMTAIDNYLPEQPEQHEKPTPSLFSSLFGTPETDTKLEPYWKGPQDYTVPKDFASPITDAPGHRWLELDPKGPMTVDNTPIAEDPTFNPFGDALMWWPIGAQQHYSFLGRLGRNAIDALKFKVWDYNYVRMGIQFYAMRRADIKDRFPFPKEDDEEYLSVDATRQSNRRGYVDGRNVVSHYSYGPQVNGMDTTDILLRYRTLAERKICMTTDNMRFAESL